MGGFKIILRPLFSGSPRGLWLGCVLLASLSVSGHAHPFQGLIYGRVTFTDDQTREGLLLWSNRQLFWEDVFDAQREENTALDFLNPNEIKGLSDQEIKDKIEWGFMHLWENKVPSKSQKFSCRFGDIGSVSVTGEKNAVVFFKNGSNIKVRGDERHRDVGARIHLIDPAGEWHRINWTMIQRIEFLPTPSGALASSVRPLYGTVGTESGELTGFIKWDQDETMTSFRLNGKKEGKDKNIPFGYIRKIVKVAPNTCEVTLLSGKTLRLSDKDDVGPTNHGLTVFTQGIGSRVVRWDNFKAISFDHQQNSAELMGYLDFKPPRVMWGRIRTLDGGYFKGKLIYDLDEQWDFETLEGKENNFHHSIALRDISLIEPQDQNHTAIVLKNGQKLRLTGHHDVTGRNWGILVWKGGSVPTYLPWNTIKSISLP